MSDSLAAHFAKTLKATRQARGWTQAELAERVGLAPEACGRLERGSILPRVETLVRLAEALGVGCDTLLGMGEAPPTPARTREDESEYASPPELRRLLGRLKKASPKTLRLLAALLSALEEDLKSRKA